MDYSEYVRITKKIDERLDLISKITAILTLSGVADMQNSYFSSLMHEQDKLLKRSLHLLDQIKA